MPAKAWYVGPQCHDLGWECALADSSTGSQWFAGKVQSWLVWLQAVSNVLGGCTKGLQDWVSAGQGMGPPGPPPGARSLHCRVVLISTSEEPQLQAQQWLFRAFHRWFLSLTVVPIAVHSFHCSCAPAAEHHQQSWGKAELLELCAARGAAGGHPQ